MRFQAAGRRWYGVAMPKTKSLVAVMLALAIAAPACSSSDCEKAYDMVKKLPAKCQQK